MGGGLRRMEVGNLVVVPMLYITFGNPQNTNMVACPTMQYHALPCHAIHVPYYAIPYHAMPYLVIPCHTLQLDR